MKLERNSLIIGIVVGVVVGLLLGALLFYVVLPVEVTGIKSIHLEPAAKAEYMALVVDSYKLDPEKDAARAATHLDGWYAEEKAQALADAEAKYEAEGRADKVQDVQDFAKALGVSEEAMPAPGEEPAEPVEAGPSFWERIRGVCLVVFIVLLIAVLAWIGYRIAIRQRSAAPRPAPAARPAPPVPAAEEWDGVGQPPLKHFFTTYELGEDTYDESFSIETGIGDFLGECGVGISETIGVGDPDKVTAFEVWLFDKSDIKTVTKVLMSEHAFRDETLRARLASKGEAVLAQPGAPFTLETNSLQVRVDVSELEYGQGDSPPQSFFSKLTIELVAIAKPPAPGGSTI
jgi:hypothetical protein